MKYTIGKVAESTGLSAHTIRAWERRYGILAADRTDSNRRLYGDAEVNRLRLLKTATDRGHPISRLVDLSEDQLAAIGEKAPPAPTGDAAWVDACLRAIVAMDAQGLEAALRRAGAALGVNALVERVVAPTLREVGDRWQRGEATIAQEHLATAVVRAHLDGVRAGFRIEPGAPRFVLGTLVRQPHEIGALIAATVAAAHGWNVTYLGPNLPPEEIASAARQLRAAAVGVSLVPPFETGAVRHELRTLRTALGASPPILVGGGGAELLADADLPASLFFVTDVGALLAQLDEIALPNHGALVAGSFPTGA